MIFKVRHFFYIFLCLRGELRMLCAAMLLLTSALAQVGTASLSGAISDASGAIVPGAEVVLHSTQGAFTRAVRTGADGSYVLSSLLPGSYQLTVHAAGFQDQESGGIQLSSGQAATLNLSVRRSKVVGVRREESDVLIRLADACCGFVCQALMGTDEKMKEIFEQAKKQGYLRDV